MARKKRSRSKRAKKSGGGGTIRIPVVPIVVVVGVVAIVAIVGFLVIQANQDPASSDDWAIMEADPAPDLPGVFVDLQTIYNGTYGAHGDNATALHVQVAVDYAGDGNSNPPAGGPHWGSRACPRDPADAPLYCGPAPWGIYREPWRLESLVHNIEHGGVAVWYNTEDSAIIEDLEELVRNRLEDGDILVMVPYPDMEEDHIALTSWARIDKFPIGEYTENRVEDYIDAHVRRFNPEQF